MDDDHECYDNWEGGYEDGKLSMWRDCVEAVEKLPDEMQWPSAVLYGFKLALLALKGLEP